MEIELLDKELDKLCRAQVRKDNEILGISSAYLPNVILTPSPNWCLVSPEPSMGNVTIEQFENSVKNGFRNFLKYEGDLLLHYCAYKFLCDGNFGYHITDISKGAMKVRMADHEREARYTGWFPILKKELQLLGEPRLIAIGNDASNALVQADFVDVPRVRHFATRLDDWFRGYYLAYRRHSTHDLIKPFLKEWKDFLLLLTRKLPKDCSNISLVQKLQHSVTDSGKGRFLYYRDEFLDMVPN